jgi:peptidoglycan hydrolase-like protein with peptidoglycan-binding domain
LYRRTPTGEEMARRFAFKLIFLCLGVLLWTGGGSWAQPQNASQGERMAWSFANNVVKLRTVQKDGSSGNEGFGFVFGQRNGKVFVATADHVVRDPDRGEGKILITFYREQGREYEATLLQLRIPQNQGDLAVLEVPQPSDFLPNWPKMVPLFSVKPSTRAWRIGKQARWIPAISPGIYVGPQNGAWMGFENLDTPRGSSGGPIVTEQGVVGMVVADGGDAGVPSYVLPIETIGAHAVNWQLPWNLASPDSPGPSATASEDEQQIADQRDQERRLNLGRGQVTQLQRWLSEHQFTVGTVDGVLGDATRAAIKDYQRTNGLPVTGFVTDDIFRNTIDGRAERPTGNASANARQEQLIADLFSEDRSKRVSALLTLKEQWSNNASIAIPLSIRANEELKVFKSQAAPDEYRARAIYNALDFLNGMSSLPTGEGALPVTDFATKAAAGGGPQTATAAKSLLLRLTKSVR